MEIDKNTHKNRQLLIFMFCVINITNGAIAGG